MSRNNVSPFSVAKPPFELVEEQSPLKTTPTSFGSLVAKLAEFADCYESWQREIGISGSDRTQVELLIATQHNAALRDFNSLQDVGRLRDVSFKLFETDLDLANCHRMKSHLLNNDDTLTGKSIEAMPLGEVASLLSEPSQTAPSGHTGPKDIVIPERVGKLPTGKVHGVVSLNVLRATLEMMGFPDWRKRFESWSEVPHLRLRCVELFPGQPFSSATIELLIAWFQEHGLSAAEARHLPLSEAVRRLATESFNEADGVEGDKLPSEPFAELRQFAREKLKGQERAVVEALCTSEGELLVADLAITNGIDWDDVFQGFKNVQQRLNPKLKPMGWTLSRQNNAALLKPIKS